MPFTINNMQSAQATNFIVWQLNRSERRQEQLPNTHHIVIADYRDIFRYAKPLRQ